VSAAGQRWQTKLGVVLAVAGSAVGLGNFLRFPGLAAKYGGGIFLIPYFTAILLIGIPICWAEWGLGRRGGRHGFNAAPGIFRVATGWRHGHFLGVLALLVPLVVYMYYVYIEAWCMAYAWYYLTGQMSLGTDPVAYANFFEELVGTGGNGAVTSHLSPILVLLGLSICLNLLLVYRGINHGIERFCTVAMPVLILCALLVLLRVLTLGTPDPNLPEQNVLNGLGFMWNPKLEEGQSLLAALANPDMWLQATGQVFFSISIGFGIIISYSSYLAPDDDVVLSGLTSTATNEFCEICLGGLITIPAAFLFLGPAPIEKVAGSTFGVGFYTLPLVFEHMPLGAAFGFLWFFLLFLAAVTSSISMLQPVLAFIEESLGLNRARATAALAVLSTMGTAIVVHFSRDLVALDAMDFWIGQIGIFLLATTVVLVFAWVLGADEGIREVRRGALLELPPGFRFVIRYVSPTYLILIFLLFLWQNGRSYLDQLGAQHEAAIAVGFVVAVAALLAVGVGWAFRGQPAIPRAEDEAR